MTTPELAEHHICTGSVSSSRERVLNAGLGDEWGARGCSEFRNGRPMSDCAMHTWQADVFATCLPWCFG